MAVVVETMLINALGNVKIALRLADEGQTIAIITHDVKVASQAERMLRMRDGQVFGT